MPEKYKSMKKNNLNSNFSNALFIRFKIIITLIGAFFVSCNSSDKQSIRIYEENPFYWQYKGKPVLLLGGSREDNLFNDPEGLEEHLDLLVSVGGNFIRNNMGSRDRGNVWPFKQNENGLYDLAQWNDEYWERFENLLKLSLERDIIVQVEFWDPWDLFKSQWNPNPFNPKNNINYSAEESGLEEVIEYTNHSPFKHKFFQTPPELADIPVVRKYQDSYVEKILSISLKYPNVLYNIRNECREWPEWARYWARFIRENAENAEKEVFITDMRRPEDFTTPEQMDLLHDRTHFDFIEISQNSHNKNQEHYDQIMKMRKEVKDHPVPMNNVKIYGGTAGWTSGIEEGTRRFWRNIFAGSAAVRFHRPGSSDNRYGIGLNELAQTHIRSMNMLLEEMHFFKGEPRNDLLSERDSNEAYCFAEVGAEYVVYFPDGGNVRLDLKDSIKHWQIRWLDILASEWKESVMVSSSNKAQLEIKSPQSGHWVALVSPASAEYSRSARS